MTDEATLRRSGMFAASLLLGCSTSSPTAPAPDGSVKLNAQSASDLAALCDWMEAQEGGYGAVTACDAGSGPLQADPDRATCVTESTQHFLRPSCPGTVGDWMACVRWRLSNWCSANPPAPTGSCASIQAGCFDSTSSATDSGTE